MLIGTFEVQVDRRLDLRALRADAFERQARIGPHVHHVVHLVVLCRPRRPAAPPDRARTRLRCRPSRRVPPPSAAAPECADAARPWSLCTKSAIGTPHVRWREMHQSGRPSIMPVMRCSPQAGVHLHLLDIAQRVGTQSASIHADEPLRRGAEDHRRLVAPAMRIAVANGLVMQQPPALLELLDDRRAALFELEPADQRRIGQGSARRCRPG